MDDASVHVGESIVASGGAVGQTVEVGRKEAQKDAKKMFAILGRKEAQKDAKKTREEGDERCGTT